MTVGSAVRESVVVAPDPGRAAIAVTGKDRVTWLNGLVTCDLAKLGPDEAAYGLLVEKKGRIQADLVIVPSPDALLLFVPPSLAESLLATLDHYLIMEDAELSLRPAGLVLAQGPRALELIDLAPARGRLDLLGTGGVALAAPADELPRVRAAVEQRAASVGGVVATPEQWEALTIERGLPRFGVEFDTSLYPQEASLEKLAVSFSKGCYLGQEVVYMLENRGHVKQKLVAIEVAEGETPLEVGAELRTAAGETVGQVRSTAIGPSSGRPVAIAMVKWAHAKPGTELVAADRRAVVRASGRA